MHVPFDLHVPIAVCRHAELGCTARLSEVTGLSQAVALTRPSVVWLNLESSLRENCPPWIAVAYPGPDPANCRRAHCHIKMVDSTDNQKKSGKCRERNRSVLYQVHTG